MNNGHPPFVRFAKPLYDVALRAGFSGTHWGVFLTILRLTVGDGLRAQATVSVGAIEKASGRDRAQVARVLRALIREGVVIEHEASHQLDNGSLSARVVSLQTDSERWGKYAVHPEDVAAFLRHDWDVAPAQQVGAQEQQGGVAPTRTQQGAPAQHTKDRGGTSSPPSPLTQRAKRARRAGGGGAPSAPRQSKGKELPGAHAAMTGGAADPGRAYLYGDDFDDTEVPA